MKRFFTIILCVFSLLSLASCSLSKEIYDVSISPAQIESICQLATLNCHYSNVAIGTQKKSTGIQHIGEKDRVFWIEYTGTAKIGVDLEKLDINIHGENIEIYMPAAEIISTTVEKNKIKDTISSPDSSWNENKIPADKQTEAINNAQNKMKETIKNDYSLLKSARDSAKLLVENYINSIGDLTGKEYKIVWLGVDNSTSSETTTTTVIEAFSEITTETIAQREN